MHDFPVLDLLNRLIACPSVTPQQAGCYEIIEEILKPLGFRVLRKTFQAEGTAPVENFYARFGTGSPNICFAGHVDVVPVGREADWRFPPFVPTVHEGKLYGRGASDMKGAVACFVAALATLAQRSGALPASVSILLTADEEGVAINGTRPMLAWLKEQGENPDYCVVGEPTNPQTLGEMMKVGRRGSLNGVLTIEGKQGHVAYPHLADNPNHTLLAVLSRLLAEPLDGGNPWFPPSSLQVTSVDTDNLTTNLIPAQATARFNIRFNSNHTSESLTHWLHGRIASVTPAYHLVLSCSGESFLTPPGALSAAMARAVQAVTGLVPEESTSGGTSDARFVKDYCPVLEFGGVNATIHQVDEHCAVDDIPRLAAIYTRFVEELLSGDGRE